MAAYKGQIKPTEIERRYPHIVELMVPLSGFGTKLNLMHDWHSFRGLESQRGSGRYHEGRHYVRWCFANPEDAKAFQAEFGGELNWAELVAAAANHNQRLSAKNMLKDTKK